MSLNGLTQKALFCLSLLICGFTIIFAEQKSQAKDKASESEVVKATAAIVEAREKVKGYVLDIKAKYKGKETDPDYLESIKKYRVAYAKYSGWVSVVKGALREKKVKDLQADSAYKNLALEAGKSSADFISFVESKTGQSKGISTVLSSLADLGLKVWKGIKDMKREERIARANDFEKDVTWKS